MTLYLPRLSIFNGPSDGAVAPVMGLPLNNQTYVPPGGFVVVLMVTVRPGTNSGVLLDESVINGNGFTISVTELEKTTVPHGPVSITR